MNKLIDTMKKAIQLTEKERVREAKIKLMLMKTQENIKDIVFINAVLNKYESVLEIIGD